MKRGPGYSIRAVTLDHNDWIDLPRNRVIMLAFSPQAGGKKAAEWAIQQLDDAIRYRRMGPPVPVASILKLGTAEHRRRLQQGEAHSSEL